MPAMNHMTEKRKKFCHEYYTNGGNITEAYLAAYDTTSKRTAQNEGSILLQKPDIQEYLATLNKPAMEKAQSEREKKRQWLWRMIESANSDSDRLRAMDILNKMDSEYININRNIDDTSTALEGVDTSTLKLLAKDA